MPSIDLDTFRFNKKSYHYFDFCVEEEKYFRLWINKAFVSQEEIGYMRPVLVFPVKNCDIKHYSAKTKILIKGDYNLFYIQPFFPYEILAPKEYTLISLKGSFLLLTKDVKVQMFYPKLNLYENYYLDGDIERLEIEDLKILEMLE